MISQVGISRDPLIQSLGRELHDQHLRAIALASGHGRGPFVGAEDGETGAANQLGTDEDRAAQSWQHGNNWDWPYLAITEIGCWNSSLGSKKPEGLFKMSQII